MLDASLLKSLVIEDLYGIRIPPSICKKSHILSHRLLSLREYEHVQETAYTGSRYLDMAQPVSGAPECIRLLQDAGCEVVIITSRGGPFLENARAWIEMKRWDIPVFGSGRGNSKAPLAKLLGVSTFIDDDLYKLRDLKGLVPQRILFSQPYNEHEDLNGSSVIRAHSWEECLRLIVS